MCQTDEVPRAWTEKWRKARKDHKCIACRESIRSGHRYHYSSGIWENRPADFKHCARCWRIFSFLVNESNNLEGVQLDLDCGEVLENPPERIAELAFMRGHEVADEEE